MFEIFFVLPIIFIFILVLNILGNSMKIDIETCILKYTNICSPIWIYLIRCHASMDRFGNCSGNESCLIFTASRFGPFGRISNVIIGEIVNHTHELSYAFIICVVHFFVYIIRTNPIFHTHEETYI